MPKIALEIKATLENVKSVSLTEPYVMRIRQTGGTEERDNVEMDSANQEELFGSKGVAHFKLKWDKKDKFEAYATILKRKEYTKSDAWAEVAVFEVRGLDFVEWKPSLATIVATSGATFQQADLSDPEGFSDYDDRAEMPVSVTEIQHRFKPV